MLIGTIAELKEDLYSYISDAHKDAYGFRCRFDYSEWTTEALMSEASRMTTAVSETMAEDEIRETANQAELEAQITTLIQSGAGDRNTAMRWMYEAETEAEDWNMGLEHFFWAFDISFEAIRAYCKEFETIASQW